MIICDLCKEELGKVKDIYTWRKNGNLYVTCLDCKKREEEKCTQHQVG